MLNLRQGNAPDAETYFRKLVELTPNMPDAHEFLALSLSVQGKHSEAATVRSRAKELRR